MRAPPPVADEGVINYVRSLSLAPLWEQTPEERRRDMRRECLAGAGTPAEMETVVEISAGGVPARLYRPTGLEQGMFLWVHGGAWMHGDLDCYDSVVRAIAKQARSAVVSIDYRLVPEHRFPAALEDCWAALQWARGEADVLAIGGDSSGGNLAAATALRARDAKIELCLQALIYPVLDYRVGSAWYGWFSDRYSDFAGIAGYGASRVDAIRYIWEEYVPDPGQRLGELASPLRAKSLANVAPAFVVTAEHDILRGEAEDYADRLRKAEVAVQLVNYDGQVHGFFPLLGTFVAARDAASKCAAALQMAFARHLNESQPYDS